MGTKRSKPFTPAELVDRATAKIKPSRVCILCPGPQAHPWAGQLSEAIRLGASIRGLSRVMEEEGDKHVTLNRLKSHKEHLGRNAG